MIISLNKIQKTTTNLDNYSNTSLVFVVLVLWLETDIEL